MPQRNIYVRQEDEEVFEEAKDLLEGRSLSETVVEALKSYIKEKESGRERKYDQFNREMIPVGKLPRGEAPDRWVEFTGRELASQRQYEDLKEPEAKYIEYAVYQGIRGGLLLTGKLVFPTPADLKERTETGYLVGRTVEELKMLSDQKEWGVPVDLLDEAKKELGSQIVEKPLEDLELGG